ncbi:MAG: tetratricopeptide repeat protein [Planctomycetes bacterium]|nr:tetratricopeptide repeat protein [Planctomycetota bacterium]
MPDAGERRYVTILFSDLSGFTALSERMDPEDVRDMVDALFRKFRVLIEAQGGTVDKFIGDAVMAVFGAPEAHEDDPLRAVRAGLGMQRAMAGHNAEHGLSLRLRVGIHAGDVLWGSIGGDRATATGDAVNVAQRLESAARPGAVLVSRAVARGAGRGARFAALAPVKLKGREDTVDVCEAAEGAPAAETVFTEGRPFAGRDAELARLVERCESGRGVLLVVEGEAGIGKSRLMQELKRTIRARREDAWVATGRAAEAAPWPLAPLAEIVRAGAGSEAPADIAAWLAAGLDEPDPVRRENVAHLVALSLGSPVPGSRVLHLDPARLAEETRFAWLAWLRARAARAPVVWVLEDLHAADAGTLALLEFLAPRLADAPVALLGTARPGAALPAAFERLDLHELPENAVLALAAPALGGPLSPALARFLMQSTAGNPYYLEELTAFLRDEGLVGGNPLELRVEPDRVPRGLQGLLTARIDALGPEGREALKGASVVGRSFWRDFLSRALERGVDAAVADLRGRQLVFPQEPSLLPGDEEFVFRHSLLRGAAYSLLTKKERLRLHGVVARLLDARIPDGGRRVRELAARHWESAGDAPRAAAHWRDAAEEAFRGSAFDECLGCAAEASRLGLAVEADLFSARAFADVGRPREALAAALRVASSAAASPAQKREAGVMAARAESTTGDFEPARAHCDAIVAAGATDLAAAEALNVKARALLSLGRFDEAVAEVGRARTILENLPEGRETSRCAAGLAGVAGLAHLRRGDLDAAGTESEAALAIRRAIGDRSGEADALANFALIENTRGNTGPALARFEEVLAIRRDIGDRTGEAGTISNMGTVYAKIGELSRAQESFEKALPVLRDVGHQPFIASTLNNLGNVLRRRGFVDDARRLHEESLAIRRRTGERNGQSLVLGSLCEDAVAKGEYRQAREWCLAALAIDREIGVPHGVATGLVHLARIAEALGDPQEAARLNAEALALRRSLGDRGGVADCLLHDARLRLARGDVPGAEASARESLDVHRQLGTLGGVANALSILGTLHDRAARYDDALAAHREALALRRASGDRSREAISLKLVGTSLEALGDFDGAEKSYGEALTLCRAVGDRGFEAAILDSVASLARERGDYGLAVSIHRQAVALARELGLSSEEASALCHAGAALRSQGEFDAALEAVDQSLALRRSLGSRGGVAECLAERAKIHSARGDLAPARADFEASLAEFRFLGEPRETARVLNDLGDALFKGGDLDAARAASTESLSLRTSIGDRPGAAASLLSLGNVHAARGDTAGALRDFTQALDAFRSLSDRPGTADALNNLGWLHARQGDRPAALAHFARALALRRELGDRHGQAWILYNTGRVHQEAGDTGAALAAFEEALPIFRSLKERLNLGGTLVGIAECRMLKGDRAKAREAASEAVTLLQDLAWKEGLESARGIVAKTADETG